MGTSFYAPQPLPYQAYSTPAYAGKTVPFQSATDPRKLAQNQRAVVQSQGDVYQNIDEQLANEYAAQQAGTQGYINPIESTLAGGGGGYKPGEASQIELSPEDKQNIITGAGIAAGAGTASAVGAAERAAAASGGNPAALATYRARAAQTEGANAGDAMTQARIQAQQAGSQGAQAVGNATMAQQNKALDYYTGLQGQQGQQAQSEQALGQGAYGTETSGTNAAVDTGLKASQTPTTWDKIIGGVAGAATGFLSDGDPGDAEDKRDEGIEAVTGEDGPELIVENAAAPVRTQFYMDDGGGDMSALDPLPIYNPSPQPDPNVPNAPSWGSRAGGALQSYLQRARATQNPQAQRPQGNTQWSPVDTYTSAGNAIGAAARLIPLLADGQQPAADAARPGPQSHLVTSPTRVNLKPNDMVVPLTHRPMARVRPSAAVPAIKERQRAMYGARA